MVDAANHVQQEILALIERLNIGKHLLRASRYDGYELTLLRPAGSVETQESILLRLFDGLNYV